MLGSFPVLPVNSKEGWLDRSLIKGAFKKKKTTKKTQLGFILEDNGPVIKRRERRSLWCHSSSFTREEREFSIPGGLKRSPLSHKKGGGG